jgi:tripartite ATP-independent transporter DctM subunit
MVGTSIGLLFLILGISIPVGIGLGLLALALNQFYSPLPLTVVLGELAWSSTNSFVLVAVPFYILLGEIVLRAGIAERMYNALVQWVSWLPGGLMHSNVAACATFAAISGSSVATAVTIGTVALNEVKKHRYNERLFLGTLAAGGTLGILIPPSINMIVYGVITETSVPQLYLAGFVPGLVLAGLFSLTVLLACWWRPHWGGEPIRTSWEARWKSLPNLVPPLIIFLVVIGSIYAGLATATESAALGIIAALILAALYRQLNWQMLRAALEGTVRTTAVIMLIILGAYFLNVVINAIGLTRAITDLVTTLQLTPIQLLLCVIVFYIILGCFMETLSMMVATVPITAPLMISSGFDPVWFGILIVLLLETAMITPPVGINLFVVQSVRERGRIHDVVIGSAPFVLTLFIMIALVCIFPQLVLWLPQLAR